MNRLRTGLSAIIALFGITFITIAIAQRANNDQKGQENKEEATVVQDGVMTERQREHSKLYKGYGTGQKIIDLLKTHDEIGVFRALPNQGSSPSAIRLTLDDVVQKATCNADAIVVGTLVSKLSQLAADGEFIFTDYTVTVDTLLKNDKSDSIQPLSNIIVTRPGGKIMINGKVAAADDSSVKRLIIGDRYLLFLKNIASTDAYTTLEETGSISATDGKMDKLTNETAGDFITGTDASSLTDTIKVFVARGCSSKP